MANNGFLCCGIVHIRAPKIVKAWMETNIRHTWSIIAGLPRQYLEDKVDSLKETISARKAHHFRGSLPQENWNVDRYTDFGIFLLVNNQVLCKKKKNRLHPYWCSVNLVAAVLVKSVFLPICICKLWQFETSLCAWYTIIVWNIHKSWWACWSLLK